MYEIIIFVVLMLLGYFIGTHREKKHYQSIFEREKEYGDVMLFDLRHIPDSLSVTGGELVGGHVVISVDYFKKFVGGLRLLLGGRLKVYESLLDRGRREAILRMKEQARQANSNMVFNVKFETASISKGVKGNIGSIEVFVYGSAVNAVQ